MNSKLAFTFLFIFPFFHISFAHLPPKKGNLVVNHSKQKASYRSDCASGTAQIDLAINNVRARLSTSGDSWWNNSDAGYIVPNVLPGEEAVASIFAGALWLGGFDEGDNLKTACQTYGSASGDDEFWPGPLNDEGQTNSDNCANWDRFFTVTKTSIDLFQANWEKAISENRTELNPDEIPEEIKGWPALGNPFFESIHGFPLPPTNSGFNGLGGFWDHGGTPGKYEPQFGDFPILSFSGCNSVVEIPDQMTFSIINDGGGIHSNSNGDPLLVEIQNTAFAFKTTNEVKNMTFYQHRVINRRVENLEKTHLGIWMDPDLGCYTDDYIGCDVDRDLAYAYNSDDLDGDNNCEDCPVPTYCTDIPVVGIDLLRGPLNEYAEELKMSSFTYYNNLFFQPNSAMVDPQAAPEFYNYLTGFWRDGTLVSYGGSGYTPASQPPYGYAFTSPPDDHLGWSMCSENFPPGDFRTIQAVGPFTFLPGAIAEMITGVIWVPSIEHPCPDLSTFFDADDKAQSLLDNCFEGLSTNLLEPQVLNPIVFYPNPFSISSEAFLQVEALPAAATVSIFDINGRLLKTYIGDSQMQLDLLMDLNRPKPGTYIIQVQAEGYETEASKLLIME